MIDPFKIWLQVKGTKDVGRFKRKNGDFSYPLPYEHCFKLIRSKDLSLVVLWDITKNLGYWCNPKASIDQWEMYLGPDENVSLPFKAKSIFDVDEAIIISWRARIEHYAMLISNASIRDFLMAELSDLNPGKNDQFRRQVILLAYDFLKIIGVLDDRYLDPKFLEYYKNAKRNIKAKGQIPADDECKRVAAGLAMMGILEDIAPGIGMPAMMIELISDISIGFIDGLNDPNVQADLAEFDE